MLKKVKQISYSPNSSQVHFDPPIQFMDGDDNVATIQLRGELDNSIKAVLRVKPPKGEVIEVEGKTVPYKSIAREFKVPTNIGVGKYKAQLVLTQGTGINKSINKSEIFEYEVLPSL